ncbi:sodium channel subunit beta-2 [Neoarius graeffei]|uniref:sodium channel subunit beta-2 n=1 Tax=Neoarius graeffei TaxID=443677 RepID=UPI00298CA905|nr:sodium channel subunit beta-2 [Neoarius graeffei]
MAFKKKLSVWTNRVNRGVFDMFGCLSSLADEGVDLGQVPVVIAQRLTETLRHFDSYFPSKSHLTEKQWVRDPFTNPETSALPPVVQDKPLELSCDADEFLVSVLVSSVSSMEVLVAQQINALNGTMVKISCIFNSCYKLDTSRFSMNWTYQETKNDSEVTLISFKNRITPWKKERFGDRVKFAGNLDKNDLSITISDVQLTDEGIYNCYVRNPPDRVEGHGRIQLSVVTELPPPRDSTIAVAVGASIGGMLALVILSMVVIKCVRRHKKQELISDEQKMEEEGKTDGDGGTEEGTKQI